jgi:hypothetical protein
MPDEPTVERYRTASGSRVEISGEHRGISVIEFDWFEEGACIEARPSAETGDRDEPMLYWFCECHGDGQARLRAIKPSSD